MAHPDKLIFFLHVSMMVNSLVGKINNKVDCDFLNSTFAAGSSTDRVCQAVSIQVNLLKACIRLTPLCKRSSSCPGSESQRLKIKTGGEKMDKERLAAKPALPAGGDNQSSCFPDCRRHSVFLCGQSWNNIHRRPLVEHSRSQIRQQVEQHVPVTECENSFLRKKSREERADGKSTAR